MIISATAHRRASHVRREYAPKHGNVMHSQGMAWARGHHMSPELLFCKRRDTRFERVDKAHNHNTHHQRSRTQNHLHAFDNTAYAAGTAYLHCKVQLRQTWARPRLAAQLSATAQIVCSTSRLRRPAPANRWMNPMESPTKRQQIEALQNKIQLVHMQGSSAIERHQQQEEEGERRNPPTLCI